MGYGRGGGLQHAWSFEVETAKLWKEMDLIDWHVEKSELGHLARCVLGPAGAIYRWGMRVNIARSSNFGPFGFGCERILWVNKNKLTFGARNYAQYPKQ